MRERTTSSSRLPDVQAALGDAPEPAPVILDPAKAAMFPKGWVDERPRARSTGATTTSACSSA